MNDVEQIKQRLDIVDVVRDYLTVKQAGGHYKALCPFHHESSPSFMLNKERQIWHCFGCNEGGDIFSFVQRVENIDFREALKILAEKAGVELTNTTQSGLSQNERVRLLELLNSAAAVYHRILLELPGAGSARAYLERRGLSKSAIEIFQIGFSPDSWELITQYFQKKNTSAEDLVAAGLSILKTEGRQRLFDRFRGRIMFPFHDAHGRVIGFTGRVLVETKDNGGKYMNSPETPLFHKGSAIYALHLAKQAIKEKKFAVLVEGQMDVIACHEIGMKNTIACSGTALTTEQLKMIKRYTDELRMAFDSDAAGQHAAERSVAIALAEGFTIKMIRIPEGAGKDADECIRKDKSVWEAAVANAAPFMEVLLQNISPTLAKDPKEKRLRAERFAQFIAMVPSAVERDHWIQHGSLQLGVAADTFQEIVLRARAGQNAASPQIQEKVTQNKGSTLRKLIEERVMALLQTEFCLFEEIRSQIPEDVISDDAYRALYKEWTNQYTAGIHSPSAPIQDPTLELLLAASYADFGQKDRQSELRALAKRLRELYLTEHRESLIREIGLAEAASDTARVQELLQRYQKLIV